MSSDFDNGRAGDGLRREQNLAQKYLDIAGVILIVLDKDGNIVLLNRKGHEILEYGEGKLVGRSWFETCLPERDQQRVLSAFRQLMSGDLEPVEYFENPVLTRSGTERIIAWHNTVLTDERGQRIGTLSSGEDITERIQAQEALQRARDELEQRVAERTAELDVFRQFAEASGQGFGMADLSGRALYANPTLGRLCGVDDPAAGLGQDFTLFHADEDRQKLREEVIPTVMQEGQWVGELAIKGIDGRLTPIIANYFLVRDEKGHPSRIAAVITDISEQKHEQETLRQLLDSHDRDRRLIAYEIHDGLAQELVGAQIQLQVAEQCVSQEAEKALESLQACEALLAKGIAEARHLISGLRPPILDESGVIPAIEHLVDDIQAEGELEIDFASCCLLPERLEPLLENTIFRIIQESLTNVRKHSKSDRARLEIVQHDDLIRIEIRDWGEGFDRENIPTGCFGLRGIQERARLLGGQATVESKPHDGTRIAVELPVVEK